MLMCDKCGWCRQICSQVPLPKLPVYENFDHKDFPHIHLICCLEMLLCVSVALILARHTSFFTHSGTNRYFNKVANRGGITSSMVDVTNPEELEKAIQKNTKVRVGAVLAGATCTYMYMYICINQ